MQRNGPERREDRDHQELPSGAARAVSRSRLAHGTVPVEEHKVLVSAALVEEEAHIHRVLQHRSLPPARFRSPVELPARAEVYFPPPPPRRLALCLFSAALALTSLALAGWNAYWLAAPLRDAVSALVG